MKKFKLFKMLAVLIVLITSIPKMEAKDIYYWNEKNFSGVKCHNWGTTSSTWCNGEEQMSKTTMSKNSHDYYKITLKNANNDWCKFYSEDCKTDGTGDINITGNCFQGDRWINMLPITGGTFYLDNSLLKWTPNGSNKVQLFVGDGGHTNVYDMSASPITNTMLYYYNMSSYGGATYIRFALANYDSNDFGPSNVPTTSTAIYEGTYEFNSSSLYIFSTESGDVGTDISPEYQTSGYSSLNRTITLAAKIKATGSASYVAGTSKGQLGASSYTFSNYNTCTTTSGNASVVAVGGTSGTFSAGYTANTTLTVSNVNSNYTFRGWYDADGNKLSENTTYAGYRPRGATTVYAYFEENTYNVTAVASPTAGGTVTPSSATAFGRVSGGDITATYNEGYYFTGWTGGSGTYGSTSSNNTTFTPSADNQTVTANFGYTWCVKGGFPNEVSFGVEHLLEHVGKNASDKDTCYLEITLPANTTFDFKIFARDHSTWWSCSSHEAKTVYTYTSHGPHTCYNDNENENMTITTAGAGTYKFAWNITDRLLTIYYPTSYKVAYNANGGSGSVPTDDDYYASGATVTAKGSGSLTKSNYNTLAYWNTQPDCSGTDIAITTGTFSISADKTLYAKWTQSITLNANGGASNTTATAIWNHAGPFAPAATQTYSDHTLVDYRTSDGVTVLSTAGVFAGTDVSDGNSVAYITSGKWAHAAATTLYAHWKVNTPTISCTDNEITMSVPTGSTVYYTYTTDGSDPATPTSDSDEYNPEDKPTISQNKKFKAIAVQTGCDDSDVSATYSATYTPVYTVTHNPTHASKSSGETSVLENKAYTATYTDATGYDLPDNITVTVGGTPLSVTTDYTWTKATGTLSILTNKITGNVVITVTGDAETYDGTLKNAAGETIGTYTATYDAELIVVNEPKPTNAGYDIGGFYLNYNELADPQYRDQIALADGTLLENTSYTDETSGIWKATSAPDLIVKWVAHQYTVTLDAQLGGATGTTGSTSFKIRIDEPIPGGLTMPTKEGYNFQGYYAEDGATQIFTSEGAIIPSVTNYTNSNGTWAYTSGDLTLYAHWEAKTYTVSLDGNGATGAGTANVIATYNSSTLATITNPSRWGNVFGGWEDEDGALVIGTDGKLIASVTGYTDGSKNWTHDGIVTLYAKWTVDESKTYTLTDGTTPTPFVKVADGIYRATRTMAENNTVYLYDGTTAAGPTGGDDYEFATATGSSLLGTNSDKFKYTGKAGQTVVYKLNLNTLTLSIGHVVFYLGDKEGDIHADVTDYDGYHADLATISGTFEYRLRVNSCTEWSTLYLPFNPTDVTVWGGTSNHHLFPYYYTNSQLYQGYYVLRTPTSTDLEIEKFDQWFDPATYDALPNGNTPYIVQWRNSYLYHKYISIWGSGMTPLFVTGTNPTTDDVVRVCGNGSLTSRDVVGAYVLESDYGGGAWLRGANPDDEVSVGPFQCYILASETTTANTLVIKRRTGEDSATDLEDIYNLDRKEEIVVYTISGLRVAQYNDCSFEEAGRRMNSELSEGIYILNAGNESVKLIIR